MTDHIRFGGKCIGNFILVCFMLIIIGCSGDNIINETADNGGSSTETGNPGNITVAGYAQKGPFGDGTYVEVFPLNNSLNQTGMSFKTQTDEFGAYSLLPVKYNENYLELFAEGYYFDEIAGIMSLGELDLSAFAEVTQNESININILTTLSKLRIVNLVGMGMSFENALEQARIEVLHLFDIVDSTATPFVYMNMLEGGDENGIILAVSAILMQGAHNESGGVSITAELTDIIFNISSDISTDGVLNNAGLIQMIDDATIMVDVAAVRTNMETAYPTYTIPPFEQYILGNLNIRWTGFDCAPKNISSIEAVVYDLETGNIAAGPWSCSDQESTIIGLNAGIYDTLTVNFLDINDNVIFVAEKNDVTITARQTNIVDITPDDFISGGISFELDIDCVQAGLATIEATVYDNLDTEVQTNGPWNCGESQLMIGNVPEITGGRVVLTGRDNYSNILYMAELKNIDVLVGAGTDIGLLTIIPPEIARPINNSTFRVGDTIIFQGSGVDFQGTPLSGDDLIWTSDIDGQIGTGTTFDISTLTEGLHTITLTAVDSSLGNLNTSIILHVRAVGNIIYVGPTEPYTTIKSAIQAAAAGDKIIIRDGIYTEMIDVDKELTIESENGNNAVTIVGITDYIIFMYDADYVTFDGLTFARSDYFGIVIQESSNCTVKNCIFGTDALNNFGGGIIFFDADNNILADNLFQYNSCGIDLERSNYNSVINNTFRRSQRDGGDARGVELNRSDNNTVSGNTCEEATDGHGIYLQNNSNNNIIQNNTCNLNDRYGIWLSQSTVTNNTVLNNTCNSNSHGIVLEQTSNNFILGNICTSNDSGIWLEEATANTISENTCSTNANGITLDNNSSNNLVSNNTLTLNTVNGFNILQSSNDNYIYVNNINNSTNVASETSDNIWNSPTEITYTYNGSNYTGYLGNYYSDHNLTDSDGDGITDNPYVLPGDEPDDVYPLADTSDNYN